MQALSSESLNLLQRDSVLKQNILKDVKLQKKKKEKVKTGVVD